MVMEVRLKMRALTIDANRIMSDGSEGIEELVRSP
jgi:hypothetical protein